MHACFAFIYMNMHAWTSWSQKRALINPSWYWQAIIIMQNPINLIHSSTTLWHRKYICVCVCIHYICIYVHICVYIYMYIWERTKSSVNYICDAMIKILARNNTARGFQPPQSGEGRQCSSSAAAGGVACLHGGGWKQREQTERRAGCGYLSRQTNTPTQTQPDQNTKPKKPKHKTWACC